jgi:hypothetical protein
VRILDESGLFAILETDSNSSTAAE